MNRSPFFSLFFLAAISLPIAQVRAETTASPVSVADITAAWDYAHFEVREQEAQITALEGVIESAESLIDAEPTNAQAMVLEAMALSYEASIIGGTSALSKVKKARKLLLDAEKITPDALGDGSVYVTLGTLYHQVPGFPIGFGDKKKAREYLTKAIERNPTGIDTNYFMATFLYEEKEYQDAEHYLAIASSAPDREDRKIADAGRRATIAEFRLKIIEAQPR